MRTHPIVTYGVFPATTHKCRGYGMSNFVGDIVLSIFTGGLWIIWWIIREVTR